MFYHWTKTLLCAVKKCFKLYKLTINSIRKKKDHFHFIVSFLTLPVFLQCNIFFF